MRFASFYNILLESTLVLCMLCLLIGCSADEDDRIQPTARLIKAHAYEPDTLESYSLPLNGGGILPSGSGIITELVFDKPVLLVIMNDGQASINAKPSEGLPSTVWKLESYRLDVWNPQIGFNPERDVTLTIIYEDETGIHKQTLDVTLEAYHILADAPMIKSSNVPNNEVDVDANRLNQEGIAFVFTERLDTPPTQIKVYSGQTMLDWRIDCWKDKNTTVILLPESEDDRLLPGHEYEIHLVDFYDLAGNNGGPLVIEFQTAG